MVAERIPNDDKKDDGGKEPKATRTQRRQLPPTGRKATPQQAMDRIFNEDRELLKRLAK